MNVGIRVDGLAVGLPVDGLAVGLRVDGLAVGRAVGLGVGHPLVYRGGPNWHFPLEHVSSPDIRIILGGENKGRSNHDRRTNIQYEYLGHKIME